MNESVLCVICSRPNKPRRATPGYLTDNHCSDRIVAFLDEIVVMYAGLPGTEPVAGNDGGRRGPGFGSRSPANDTIIALHDPRTIWLQSGDLHNPLVIVESWARMLREELGEAPPNGYATMSGEVGFLVRRIDWVTRQPWVSELWGEIKEVRDQLNAITGGPRARRIGACPNPLNPGATEDLVYCKAMLYAPLYGDAIECRSCGRVWPRSEWMRLGNLLETG